MSAPHAALRATAAGVAALVMLGCGVVQFSRSTRYFATERDAGKTIQLHRGDEVTLNLVVAGGRDWTASSSDVNVARPATTAVTHFSNGQTARFFDFALVAAGRAQLVACPGGSAPCSPSTPGALTFDIVVT